MKLSGNDKKILETLFNMRGGYVLDFSDGRMTEFFKEEFGINIYDEKYDFDFPSKSKANRLRGIWLKEDVMVVGQIILSLVDYYETSLLVENKEIPQNTKELIQKGREIGARLLFNEMAKGNEPIVKAITDKTALIRNLNSIDYKALKTNEKIYLLKVLYSYYEAIIRTYYGSGIFFLTSGIDDLNDYFKVLRKRIIDIIASDDTFLDIKNSHAYTQIIEPITSLYSSAEFLDVIWDDAILPSIINMREDIADKDLFENQSEIHQVGIGLTFFLEAVKREMEKMKKYLDQRNKSFYATDLPKHKEAFEKAFDKQKKEEVIKHEHTHLFKNSIQEKDIVLDFKQEKSEAKPRIKLSDYDISFDDEIAQLNIGDFAKVSFPSHKNEHYVMRKLFSQRKNEAIDWQEIYEAMTNTKSTTLKGEEIEKQKKSVKDAVRAINARVKEICNTDGDLLLWETKCIKRLY